MIDACIIRSASSGNVLDVAGVDLGNHVKIQQFQNNGGTNQHWKLIPVSTGIYKIVSESSQKVLGVPVGELGDGAPVTQSPGGSFT